MQLQDLLFIGMILAVFWFVAVRPQQQRAKQQRAMLEALGAGDEIVTVGGIFGTVVSAGDRVRVRVADGSELEVAPQAIARVVPAEVAGGDDSDGESAADDDLADIAESVGEDDGEGAEVTRMTEPDAE